MMRRKLSGFHWQHSTSQPHVTPVICDIQDFTMAQLMLFTNDSSPANIQEAWMISPWGEFHACCAYTIVMMHNQTKKRQSWQFLPQVFYFQKGYDGILQDAEMAEGTMKVQLDEQEWHDNQLPLVIAYQSWKCQKFPLASILVEQLVCPVTFKLLVEFATDNIN